ncbi:hypothetical protein SLA2020_293690 [Shorea laevis]
MHPLLRKMHTNRLAKGVNIHLLLHEMLKNRRQKKKKAEVASTAECIASKLLGNDTIEESKELSKSIGFDTILLEKASELESALSEIEGLIVDERDIAFSKLPDHPLQMLIFFNLSPD